jgi:pyruvate, water dikinase
MNMSKANILWFKDIKKKDILKVGGKGANLGEMFGIMPVPPGFCVTVKAYELFLEKTMIKQAILGMLSRLDIEDSEKLDAVAKSIRGMMLSKPLPDRLQKDISLAYAELKTGFVAVRSSATAEDLPTASFAGQQDTYLNICGAKEVVDAVKRCFVSLYTSRAIFYRHTNNFRQDQVKISVVVQKMIDSEKAGVIFTVNPVNKNHEELIIEGSYGLGESVVSGQVTPDTYIIKKKPFKVADMNIGSKSTAIVLEGGKNKRIEITHEKQEARLLSEIELKRLTRIALEIEKHYGKPQDIEWAIEKEKVYILQSRPITTL